MTTGLELCEYAMLHLRPDQTASEQVLSGEGRQREQEKREINAR